MVFHFVQGILYTITDVKDLHEWMVDHLQRHSLFERILGDELVNLTNEIKLFFILAILFQTLNLFCIFRTPIQWWKNYTKPVKKGKKSHETMVINLLPFFDALNYNKLDNTNQFSNLFIVRFIFLFLFQIIKN